MECTCIRHTELPATTRLFADLVYHPDRLSAFYPYHPYDGSSFGASAAKIDFPDPLRADLVSELVRQNGPSPSLDLLAKPGTVTVLTGQQVGLYSGPAYTIYKALTAVRLAHDLTASGIPAVPIFWLATEDHDFAEVNHTWVFDGGHKPVRLETAPSKSAGGPVGAIPLSGMPAAELCAALQELPYGEEVAAWVEAAYTPGATLGQAFSRLLKKILSAFDIPHVDPMSPGIRDLAAPAIRAALEQAPDLSRAVLARNGELAAAGYHAQVHVEPDTSFVFLLEAGKRLAMRRENGTYIAGTRRFSSAELADRAREISPNALLRPVIQDSIFPTVAYVGGPAELAYLAQSQVIYQALLGRMPVAFPRTGFTLLDRRARKLMDRYDLELPHFFHGEEPLRERIAQRLVPPHVVEAVERSRAAMRTGAGNLAGTLQSLDKSLSGAVQKSLRKIEYQLSRIEGKIARETLARDVRARDDAAYLYNLVYPQRHLQERFYSILPFLAQYGPDLVGQIYQNIRLACPDHQLLVV
jgi:bacillithiol synthase